MNLNDSGCTNSNRKLKGFTLIEMIVVIAIIAILSSMMSIVLRGFRRDALIETQNDKARMVYTAFQDVLINCEIKQDVTMFDVREELANPAISATGAVLFFRVSDTSIDGKANVNRSTGIGDEIHIMTSYSAAVPNGGIGGQPNIASGSVWAKGTTQNVGGHSGYNNYSKDRNGVLDGGATLWDKWNTAVAGRIDPTMEGTYVVMLDLVNYEVRSVICRNLVNGKDPKTGLYDPSEVGADGVNLNQYAQEADNVTPIGGAPLDLPCRAYFIKNKAAENKAAERGVYIGCYPFSEDVYSAINGVPNT